MSKSVSMNLAISVDMSWTVNMSESLIEYKAGFTPECE